MLEILEEHSEIIRVGGFIAIVAIAFIYGLLYERMTAIENFRTYVFLDGEDNGIYVPENDTFYTCDAVMYQGKIGWVCDYVDASEYLNYLQDIGKKETYIRLMLVRNKMRGKEFEVIQDPAEQIKKIRQEVFKSGS